MKRGLVIALSAVAAVIVLVLALPFVIPVGAYRAQIEDRVTAATGHQMKIGGGLRLTIFPELGIRARDVTLANVPGAHANYLASMDGLRVGVRLLALLDGRLEVSHVELERPVLNLETSKSGEDNWSRPKSAQGEETGGASLNTRSAQFGGVGISDGRISYFKAKTGKSEVLDHIDMDIGVTDLAKPLTLDGQLVYRGQKLKLTGRVASPAAFLNNEDTQAELSLASDIVRASFAGELQGHGRADGALKFETPSLRRLAAWTGHPIAAAGGLGATTLQASLKKDRDRFALSGLRLVLDGTTITGALSADVSRDVPQVTATLTANGLDLNRYIGGEAAEPKTNGWSTTPLDLAVLKEVDGTLALSVQGLKVQSLKVDRSHAVIALDGGVLTAKLDPIDLYGGHGTAQLTVDARGEVPSFRNALTFDAIALTPFLSDTMGVSRFEGKGRISLNVSAEGQNAKAIVHDLSGSGAIDFRDGKIRGVNLVSVAQTIQSALSFNAIGKSASTDFGEMGGTFRISRGVMTNKDFHLLNRFVRMSGAGTVDLGARRVDFVITPKLEPLGTGHGGKSGLLGIGVPFRVTGPWTDLHYFPDLAGVAQSFLQGIADGGSSVGGVLGGLLGPGKKPTPQSTKPQKKQKKNSPADFLQGVFGGH